MAEEYREKALGGNPLGMTITLSPPLTDYSHYPPVLNGRFCKGGIRFAVEFRNRRAVFPRWDNGLTALMDNVSQQFRPRGQEPTTPRTSGTISADNGAGSVDHDTATNAA